jgi:hypothetical protein
MKEGTLKGVPRPVGRGTSFRYDRAQVQPLPHWQITPQRHPGLRVSVFFFAIESSFVRPTLCRSS